MSSRIDVIGGAIVVLIGLAFLDQSLRLQAGTLRSLGPGMLPAVLSGVLVLCGVALLGAGLRGKGATVEHFRATWRGPLMVGAAILLFAAAIEGVEIGGVVAPKLGLAVVGPLTVILGGFGTDEADLGDLGAVGLGLTAFCLALFNDLLSMDLPVVPGALEPVTVEALGAATTLRAVYLAYAAAAVLIAVACRRRARAGAPGPSDG